MTKELSILEFVALTATLGLEVEHAAHEALEGCGDMVEKEAKRVIGTYDYGWPQLADSTKKDRVDHGYPANEPLLRSGHMRDSIEHKVEHDEVQIGSNEQVAVWQELGTPTIPPRSFLEGALKKKTPEVLDKIGRTVVGKLSGTERT